MLHLQSFLIRLWHFAAKGLQRAAELKESRRTSAVPSFFLALFCQTASGQIYICGKTIQRVDPVTWDVAPVCSLQDNVELFDIGLTPEGEMFGIGSADGSGAHILYTVDTLSGKCSPLVDFHENFNGLVSSKNGLLYLAGARFKVFDPVSGQQNDLGLINYNCAGDLAFWGDSLIMTAATGHLVLLNLNALYQSTPLMRLDEAYPGLGAYPNCITGKRDLFAFFGGGKVIRIDIPQRRFEPATPKNIPAAGAASTGEFTKLPTALLDTLISTPPGCLESNGVLSIRLKPGAPQGTRFSLDGIRWTPVGQFESLPAGSYLIHVQNRCGSAVLPLRLEPVPAGIHCAVLPDAFTPNGDGINDAFGPGDPDAATAYILTIYNRWGEKIFESQQPWNGRNADGREAPAEVYGYLIQQERPDGRKSIRKGVVTLIR